MHALCSRTCAAALAVLVLALLSACEASPPVVAPVSATDAGLPPAVTTAPVTSTVRAPSSSPPPPTEAPVAPEVQIDDGGVGDVRVGQPIPRRYLDDSADLQGRYENRWVADAQPFEAFRVGAPGRLAVIDGPFARWAKSHTGPIDPKKHVAEAVRVARAGAVVRYVVVEERGLFTRERIGVGSTFAALSAAYPSVKIEIDPEWFEAKPTCRAKTPALPNVHFLLAFCRPSAAGEVERIVVGR
ncbi:MAG: hypothetical protein JST00_25845 [Deltaproteobacteria bacterium]|nr:hypothetical protein [Deltaproteobacteria bacterium]